MNLKRKKGAILIITLWILAILTILSVGIAGRMGLELKLSGYYRDNMKALYLAKAGIERAVAEKEINDTTPDADTLNETWANSESLFNEQDPFHSYEPDEPKNSYYTIKYTYKESKETESADLYGMEDEASKININKIVSGDTVDTVRKEQLITLLELICGPEVDATAKVDALTDWIDTDDKVQGTNDLEDATYYPNMGSGYCKNRPLDSLEELLLVKGFEDPAILYGDKDQGKAGIVDYVTIYTEPVDGKVKVNVNTASSEVLQALGFAQDLANYIISYRNNEDNPPIDKDNIGNLKNESFYSRSFGDGEGAKIAQIVDNYLTTTSVVFRVNAYGRVNNARKHINCVVKLIPDSLYEIKYWNEE